MSDTKQHKVLLSDEVWASAAERAVLEGNSLSSLCEFVLRHYLDLPDDQKPDIALKNAPAGGRLRTVYIDKPTWSQALGRKVLEGRPVSAILEQQLRAYLGLAG